MVFALCTCTAFNESNIGQMVVPSVGYQILAAFAAYLLVSLIKVNLGSSYPSDCIVAIVPILMIISANYALNSIANSVTPCSDCDGQSYNICYA